MIGLAIGALIVAWCYFVSGMALTSAVMVALTFVWWLTIVCMVIVGLILTFGGAAIGGAHGGGIGAVLGLLGGSLISVLAMIIPAGLTLGGIYVMYHALDGHVDFSTVPQPDFAIGAAMYGIAVLMSMCNRGRSSSSKD